MYSFFQVHYDRYDAKFKESHDSLTWDDVEDDVQTFKHKYIYPNIVKGEVEENSIGLWLEKLAQHSYEPAEDVPNENSMDKEKNEKDHTDIVNSIEINVKDHTDTVHEKDMNEVRNVAVNEK